MAGLTNCHLDGTACRHPRPAALLRVMGSTLFCGHCGADLPEFLHHILVRCDGNAVHVTQEAFGTLHVCGEQDHIAEGIEQLLDLTAPAAV